MIVIAALELAAEGRAGQGLPTRGGNRGERVIAISAAFGRDDGREAAVGEASPDDVSLANACCGADDGAVGCERDGIAAFEHAERADKIEIASGAFHGGQAGVSRELDGLSQTIGKVLKIDGGGFGEHGGVQSSREHVESRGSSCEDGLGTDAFKTDGEVVERAPASADGFSRDQAGVAREGAEAVFLSADVAGEDRGETSAEGVKLLAKGGRVRRDAHGGLRGRGGADVGDQFGERRIGFVTDRADHRHGAVHNGLGDHALVKRPEIFHGSAATRDQDDIDAEFRVACAQ